MELVINAKFWITVIMGIIALTLVVPRCIKGRNTDPKKKRMSRKIKAETTKIDTRLRGKDGDEVWVEYVFTVDGKEYKGSGTYLLAEYQLFKKVTVYYNPENPAENCTNLMRTNMGTAGGILWLGVIAVILVLTYIFVD